VPEADILGTGDQHTHIASSSLDVVEIFIVVTVIPFIFLHVLFRKKPFPDTLGLLDSTPRAGTIEADSSLPLAVEKEGSKLAGI
jgi:hypothetical protein